MLPEIVKFFGGFFNGPKATSPQSTNSQSPTAPPVCPSCNGFGRTHRAILHCVFPHTGALACPIVGRLGTCPECGGLGRLPAKLVAIADPAEAARARTAHAIAATMN
jgi:hypothetical protein